MSGDHTQVSAFIARETKDRLDRYVAETGMKKARVIEQALDSFLTTREEVPAEYVVPTEVVVTATSFDAVLEAIGDPGQPALALRKLMSRARIAHAHGDPPAEA